MSFFALKGMNTAPHCGGSKSRETALDLGEVMKLISSVETMYLGPESM